MRRVMKPSGGAAIALALLAGAGGCEDLAASVGQGIGDAFFVIFSGVALLFGAAGVVGTVFAFRRGVTRVRWLVIPAVAGGLSLLIVVGTTHGFAPAPGQTDVRDLLPILASLPAVAWMMSAWIAHAHRPSGPRGGRRPGRAVIAAAATALCVLTALSLVTVVRGLAPRLDRPPVTVHSTDRFGCGSLGDGRVVCWGRNLPRVFFHDAAAVALANQRACVRHRGGAVSCWSFTPRWPRQKKIRPIAGLADVEKLALSDEHGCALQKGGRVRCFRFDTYAVGGAHDASARTIEGAVDLGGGGPLSCVALGSGGVKCWKMHRVRDGAPGASSPPRAIAGVEGATAVACGEAFGCALVGGGKVRCWGENDEGQLGVGHKSIVRGATPVKGVAGAKALVAGSYHACVRYGDGKIRCWGGNGWAQMGDGSFERADYLRRATTPVQVALPGAASWLHAAANYTCARVKREIYCWGENVSYSLRPSDRAASKKCGGLLSFSTRCFARPIRFAPPTKYLSM